MTAILDLLGGVVPALALLGACVAWLFATGAIHVWTATLGKMLVWLGDHANFSVSKWGVTLGHDFGPIFYAANNDVYNRFVEWRAGAEIEIAWSIRMFRLLWQANAEAADWIGRETAQTFDWITHQKLPGWAKWAVTAGFPIALVTRLIAKAIRAEAPKVRGQIHALDRSLPAKFHRWLLAAATVALPGLLGLPKIRSEIYGLTKRNLSLSKRLHRVEGLFAASVMAAAMANVLGLPNWRCLTRGNVGRAARHFCGAPSWLVDLLLLGSVEAFIATDLCAFSNLLIKQATALRPALMELVDVEDALIGCHGTSKPLVFKLPAATLPPLQGASPLAA